MTEDNEQGFNTDSRQRELQRMFRFDCRSCVILVFLFNKDKSLTNKVIHKSISYHGGSISKMTIRNHTKGLCEEGVLRYGYVFSEGVGTHKCFTLCDDSVLCDLDVV